MLDKLVGSGDSPASAVETMIFNKLKEYGNISGRRDEQVAIDDDARNPITSGLKTMLGLVDHPKSEIPRTPERQHRTANLPRVVASLKEGHGRSENKESE